VWEAGPAGESACGRPRPAPCPRGVPVQRIPREWSGQPRGHAMTRLAKVLLAAVFLCPWPAGLCRGDEFLPPSPLPRPPMNQAAAVSCVAYSPDGKTLASSSEDGTVRLWDAPTGEPLASLTGHQSAVRSVAFSPDGKTLASADDD